MRERQWLKALGLFLAAVASYLCLWLPAHRHLASVQGCYQQQLQLQQVLATLTPAGGQHAPAAEPLTTLITASAARRAVLLHEMNQVPGSLQVAARGEALALLAWLAELEQAGVPWEGLELVREGDELVARVSLSDG